MPPPRRAHVVLWAAAAHGLLVSRTASHRQNVRGTFVITGGPCSGKTAAIEALPAQLHALNTLDVVRVPEAATLYHGLRGALPFGRDDMSGRYSQRDRALLWECWLIELKISLEEQAFLTQTTRPSIVVCDRGVLDSRAYVEDEAAWRDTLSLGGWTETDLASRYDAVVHLDVAPEGAYATVSNAARRETYAEAVSRGDAALKAWESSDLPVRRVGNVRDDEGGFPAKLRTVKDVLASEFIHTHHSPHRASSSAQRAVFAAPVKYVVAHADALAAADDLSKVYPESLQALRDIQEMRRSPRRLRRQLGSLDSPPKDSVLRLSSSSSSERRHRRRRALASALTSGTSGGGGNQKQQDLISSGPSTVREPVPR